MRTVLTKLIIIVILCLAFTNCKERSIIQKADFTATAIKEWHCIGPFRFDTLVTDPVYSFYIDNLAQYGISEAEFSLKDFSKFTDSINTYTIKDNVGTVDLLQYFKPKTANIGNVYLYAEIISETDCEMILVTDGSFAYKIWLNGDKVIEDHWKYNTNKGSDRFVPVNLNKGVNRIVAKVNKGYNKLSWKLNVTFMAPNEARKVFFDNCISDFVANPNFTDSLNIYTGPCQTGSIILKSLNNEVLQRISYKAADRVNGYINIPAKLLPDGFYAANLKSGEIDMEQKVYKGNMKILDSLLYNQIIHLKCDSNEMADILANYQKTHYCIFNRYDSLSRYDKQYWQNNRVFYTYGLYNAIEYLEKNKTLKGCYGAIIKTAYLKTERERINFLFSAHGTPQEIASKPVLVMIPYALEGVDFTTTWYYSSLDQLTIDAYLAEKNGFSIVWPFLKGSDYSHQSADYEVAGIIETLVRDYNIDPNTIFLDGDCVGGQRALLMTSRHPDWFAGVAANGPVTTGQEADGAINLVRNLYNVPVHIVHGKKDKVVPISDSRNYIKAAQGYGVKASLYEKATGKHELSKAYHHYSFEKLKEMNLHLSHSTPNTLWYCTYEKRPAELYWIAFKPSLDAEMSELLIEFDSRTFELNIESNGIEEFEIKTWMLDIKKNAIVKVYSNNSLVFDGQVSCNGLFISPKTSK